MDAIGGFHIAVQLDLHGFLCFANVDELHDDFVGSVGRDGCNLREVGYGGFLYEFAVDIQLDGLCGGLIL